MEESNGEVKHLVLVKFKDGVSEEQIEEYIKQFANLVNLVPSMKAFRWGKDVSVDNLHQGFTHVFESTFESTQGVAEYTAHPDHVKFADAIMPQLEKAVLVDFKPTKVHL
ncbi:heat stable protein 1 [Perilla frutescens var. hirtella]|uniref:Heat stable protein 1 n=1 Tax=Perilla frutescens var. hirtella TaxID=608512 RepID=A0AAD4JFX2_PERFH|nr:heat stable protein 1 [Perilla frutescens var. hirtella]